ncbi:MAG: tRNA threonylcarbamoyladenosine dehydratase, partial [bacterium]
MTSLTTMPPPSSHQSFRRTELLLGKSIMARIQAAKVILFGIGGVGSWTAEALVRTGIQHLTVVDADVICPTNLNRQLQATAHNVGQPKVNALRQRLQEIHPAAEIVAVKAMYDESSCDQFDLGGYDYVLDAIDTLKCKVLLLQRAMTAGAKVYSCMGAGAKLDPTQIRTVPLSKTKYCPLARLVRERLRQAGFVGDFTCVYSEESPLENQGRAFCGSAIGNGPTQDEANRCLGKARINGTLV